MKNLIINKFSLLFICFTLIFLASCSKEEVKINTNSSPINNIEEQVFKFEETIKLYDGKFFVEYSIKANTQNEIDYLLSLEPKIKVDKIDESFNEESEVILSEDNNTSTKEVSISESIINSNIPKGYKLSFWYNKPDNSGDNFSLPKSSYANREFTDSGARGIFVQENGYTLYCTFYSKGCSLCSGGWANRGYRNIGPNNTVSNVFYTYNYTTLPGAKMVSNTTLQAWIATSKSFLY